MIVDSLEWFNCRCAIRIKVLQFNAISNRLSSQSTVSNMQTIQLDFHGQFYSRFKCILLIDCCWFWKRVDKRSSVSSNTLEKPANSFSRESVSPDHEPEDVSVKFSELLTLTFHSFIQMGNRRFVVFILSKKVLCHPSLEPTQHLSNARTTCWITASAGRRETAEQFYRLVWVLG